jgi:biopolymer transport protein ExbB
MWETKKKMLEKVKYYSACFALLLSGTAWAEEKAEGADSANSHLAKAGEFNLMENEDPTIWVLLFLFVVAVIVTIDRVVVLLRNKSDRQGLNELLLTKLSDQPNNVNGLISEVSSKKYGLEGRVAASALKGWKFGSTSMAKFADGSMEAESRLLDKRLAILSTLGNNTPFIGLLGTVLGIMKAFRDLAFMADAGPSVVMAGISEALIATAMGLGVAIPCVMAFNVLSKASKNKMSAAREIVDTILAMRASYVGNYKTSQTNGAVSEGSSEAVR